MKQIEILIVNIKENDILVKNGSRYSRMYQVKSVEDNSLYKI